MPRHAVQPKREFVSMDNAEVFVAALDLVTDTVLADERCDRTPCVRKQYRRIKDQKGNTDDREKNEPTLPADSPFGRWQCLKSKVICRRDRQEMRHVLCRHHCAKCDRGKPDPLKIIALLVLRNALTPQEKVAREHKEKRHYHVFFCDT